MNPNGIVFGQNGRLDVGGSFVGTTANAIGFGDRGWFSATNPEPVSPLLTVHPSAFLFNQIAVGNILVNSQGPIGLYVPNGQNLLLLGGNVNVNGGEVIAFEGRLNIGAVAGAGTVGLKADDSFSFPTSLLRGNVSFTNGSQAYVFLDTGGIINITASNIDVLGGSALLAGIATVLGPGSPENQAGDITLNATGRIQVGQASRIANDVDNNSIGNGGNLNITTNFLSITGGSQLSASTFGQGNAGSIIIHASELDLSGVSEDGQNRSALTAETSRSGRAGDLRIDVGRLTIQGGAIISANAIEGSQGQGGNLTINASEIDLIGTSTDGKNRSAISTETDGSGRAGDLRMDTGQLTIQDGAIISANVVEGSQGQGGNLAINASEVDLIGTSTDGKKSQCHICSNRRSGRWGISWNRGRAAKYMGWSRNYCIHIFTGSWRKLKSRCCICQFKWHFV